MRHHQCEKGPEGRTHQPTEDRVREGSATGAGNRTAAGHQSQQFVAGRSARRIVGTVAVVDDHHADGHDAIDPAAAAVQQDVGVSIVVVVVVACVSADAAATVAAAAATSTEKSADSTA